MQNKLSKYNKANCYSCQKVDKLIVGYLIYTILAASSQTDILAKILVCQFGTAKMVWGSKALRNCDYLAPSVLETFSVLSWFG